MSDLVLHPRLLSLYQQIPLTQLMGLQWKAADDDTVVLVAPLSVNVNDKGTAFAGSLSAVIQVAGWELWRYWLEQSLLPGFVVAATECSICYQKPVLSDFEVRVQRPEVALCTSLRDKLQRHHKVRVLTPVAVSDTGGVKVQAEVTYALYMPSNSAVQALTEQPKGYGGP